MKRKLVFIVTINVPDDAMATALEVGEDLKDYLYDANHTLSHDTDPIIEDVTYDTLKEDSPS